MPARHTILPARGRLLVSTDLHGNRADLQRLAALFRRARAEDAETYWAVLGDTVHGPSPEARQKEPALYGYEDESFGMVQDLLALEQEHPGKLLYVLGNHDYGHVGGPRTGKFYPDEVGHLERSLDEAARALLKQFFARALLCVVAPCGALLAHGSPDDTLRALADLDDIPYPARDPYHLRILRGFLLSYGQPRETTAALLARLSTPALPLTMVIHGHDRDELGYFTEGDNQVCPVIFGARREHKRYVWLDLGARYEGPGALREGVEILRLYPSPGAGEAGAG